jgi:hypothetical protein
VSPTATFRSLDHLLDLAGGQVLADPIAAGTGAPGKVSVYEKRPLRCGSARASQRIRGRLWALITPEILESGRRQLRVSDRVLDVLVPEIGL